MTVAAAWFRPWCMDGRRAKAYTTRSTLGCPMVDRGKLPDAFGARPMRSAPECGAPSTNTGS